MWHIQVKVIVNLNFECGAVTFRGWLWIPSHSQNSWFWMPSCIFKVTFSFKCPSTWHKIEMKWISTSNGAQAMQRTVGASNTTHSKSKQCNARWVQAMGTTSSELLHSLCTTFAQLLHNLCTTSAQSFAYSGVAHIPFQPYSRSRVYPIYSTPWNGISAETLIP